MRKLKLEMDALVVDSFELNGPNGARGTVAGQSGPGGDTRFDSCDTCFTCDGVPTCNQGSCGGTCDVACGSGLTECAGCG